ncbi:MAG: PHP domain-containing protein [Streptosporangiales bacterium]|nr:PHP domain-containing protein [Streptosporangiales bacterium]
MRIDLHAHSDASDGTEDPAGVVTRARAAGLDVVALTDHDTVAGHARAAEALPAGLTLVPGIELSCRYEGASLHLLAYLCDPGDAGLEVELKRLRDARSGRGEAMIRKLNELGVPVTWESVRAIAGEGSLGRPHIARAMVAAGAAADFEEAMDFLGPGGPAYVTRYALEPERALELVRAAGGVAVLAHPSRGRRPVPEEYVAWLTEAGLAGIEVDHPTHDAEERRRWAALARKLGLVRTGSSDDHGELTGHRLGCETTSPEAYERLVAGATGAAPVKDDERDL